MKKKKKMDELKTKVDSEGAEGRQMIRATRFCRAVTATCTRVHSVTRYLASELSTSRTSMQCHGMHYCGEKYMDLDPIPKKGHNRLFIPSFGEQLLKKCQ